MPIVLEKKEDFGADRKFWIGKLSTFSRTNEVYNIVMEEFAFSSTPQHLLQKLPGDRSFYCYWMNERELFLAFSFL